MRDTDVLILKHLSNSNLRHFKNANTQTMAAEEEEEELLDYEEEDVAKATLTASKDGEKKGEKNKKSRGQKSCLSVWS